jgi:competence protein ComEC
MKKKKGRERFILPVSFFLLLLAILITGYGKEKNSISQNSLIAYSEKESSSDSDEDLGKSATISANIGLEDEFFHSASKEAFSITMLDVGQGLSILIAADGHYMLYDGGGWDDSAYLMDYLQEKGITRLDYIVVSHYDEDHIGGLISLMHSLEVQEVLLPNYETDSKTYQAFTNELQEEKIKTRYPYKGDSYFLGEAQLSVLNPDFYDSDDENNSSLVIKVAYGECSLLLTGDIQKEAEEKLLKDGENLESKILLLPHHGSASSLSKEFLKAVSPAYVLISVGKENEYGHPSSKSMNLLKEFELRMFRTDLQGEVSLIYDAKSHEIIESKHPCQDYSGRNFL